MNFLQSITFKFISFLTTKNLTPACGYLSVVGRIPVQQNVNFLFSTFLSGSCPGPVPKLSSVKLLVHKERCGAPTLRLRKAVFLNDSSGSSIETVSGDGKQYSDKTRNLFKVRHMPYNGLVLGEGGDTEEVSCRTVIKFGTWTKAESDCQTPLLLSTC